MIQSRSNIQIEMEGIPELPVPKILDTCDACNGDPACIKVCPARVIIWDKDGVRKGSSPSGRAWCSSCSKAQPVLQNAAAMPNALRSLSGRVPDLRDQYGPKPQVKGDAA